MKKIIISLLTVLSLISCKDSDAVLDYSQLDMGFVTNKIDVGENTNIIEIPVLLKGTQSDVPLEASAEISSTDDTALAGVDFELIDKTLTFNNCGKAYIHIKIIDNAEVSDIAKCFTITLNKLTNGLKSSQPSIKVYIINDDMKKIDITGNYTFTTQNFISGTAFSSNTGAVQIVKDDVDPNKYYIKNLIIVNGTNVFPLNSIGDFYFVEKANGVYSMPTRQDIGDYGKGEGFIIGMNSSGYTVDTPIELKQWGNKIYFITDGFAGITIDANNKIIPYYLYKKLTLEKIIL